MEVSLFDFQLPEELIAQTPLVERSASRLLVVDRAGGTLADHQFRELPNYLRAGDVLVLNNTKVLPARLYGVKEDTGAQIEILLLKQIENEKDVWEALVKPAKRVKVGTVLRFGNDRLIAKCIGDTASGGRLLSLSYSGVLQEVLAEIGEMPLPPYIHERLDNQERYQTVFAQTPGSAAAPTAGLHFTDEMLQRLKDQGVHIAYVTLHVGLGTFRPVMTDRVEEHQMHAEYYEITPADAAIIEQCRANGGRVIAVGTTACRTLESVANKYNGKIMADRGWTDIFIYPGYEFRVLDGLITNFHLPKSSLIMLVSAFAGRELVMRSYEHAIKEKYRFFSFGDAMLLI